MSNENVKLVRGVYDAAKRGDLAAGLLGRDREEQGSGQRDGNGGIACRAERMQLQQSGEPALAGPAGVRETPRPGKGGRPAGGRNVRSMWPSSRPRNGRF